MCTLTLLRQQGGIRVYMNRDERHSRAPERKPSIIDPSNRIYGPLDPESGGTWIAHNGAGYWGCLLNGYFEPNLSKPRTDCISRGVILPSLLAESDPIDAIEKIDPRAYQSFRLLIGNASRFVLWVWDGHHFREGEFHATFKNSAYFLSSSSWQQDQVIRSRAELFSEWAAGLDSALERHEDIPDFHLSSLPTSPSAPLMFRPNSCTKSITSLWAQEQQCQMSYQVTAWQQCA